MAFEGLSGRLSEVFKKLKGRGKVKESDIKEVMREVRMALLEADVNYKVAKDFKRAKNTCFPAVVIADNIVCAWAERKYKRV